MSAQLDGLCASLLGLSANSRRRHCPVGQVMSWSLAEMERRRAFANRISNEPSDAIAILARDEALYLAGLSEQMRARWNRQLYRLAAREIETSFAEARRRLDVEGALEATG
jgi:hypothetical protein